MSAERELLTEFNLHDLRWLTTSAFVTGLAVVTHIVHVQQDFCLLGDPKDDHVIRIEFHTPPAFKRIFQDTDQALQGLSRMPLDAEAPTGELFDEGCDANSRILQLVHKVDDGRFLVRLEQHWAVGRAHLVQKGQNYLGGEIHRPAFPGYDTSHVHAPVLLVDVSMVAVRAFHKHVVHVELWDDPLALCLSSVIFGLPSPSYAVAAPIPVQETHLHVLIDLILSGALGVCDLRSLSGTRQGPRCGSGLCNNLNMPPDLCAAMIDVELDDDHLPVVQVQLVVLVTRI